MMNLVDTLVHGAQVHNTDNGRKLIATRVDRMY